MTIVGVPTEVKKDEYRVGLRPVGAEILTRDSHTVLVQAGAGIGSGYEDSLYKAAGATIVRSEEHTSELQSRRNLVCRLLLEKKKKKKTHTTYTSATYSNSDQ